MSLIPNALRVPLFYMAFDNSLAVSGTPVMMHKILVLGQFKAASAPANEFEQHRITDDEQAYELFGDSMLTDTILATRKADSFTELIAMGINDLSAGAQAKGDGFTVTGKATAGGVLYLMVHGRSVQVAVSVDDTADTIAASIVAKIAELNSQAGQELRVTAVVKGGTGPVVEVTTKEKGQLGNDIDLRVNYYQGETFPKGVTVATGKLADGAGTPDMAAIIAALGDEWFNHIVCPWNDQQSINVLRDELLERWGPMKMMEATAYTAYRGNHAETSTWGSTRNDFLVTCMGTNKMPTPPWQVAASYAGIAAFNLAIDPARPLQTLTLPGVLPPAKGDQWDMTERNLHLFDGVATYFVDAGGNVCIEREISTYQTNKFGSPDPSYLDITTPATLGYYRYAMKAHITQKYPRHKLAGDDVLDELEPGQPVVTPKIMRTDFLDKYLEMVGKGLMEDYETFASTLNVYRNKDDKNRLEVWCSPDIINGLRILATHTAFKL
ncbi:phage tail sheath subtilisin-like domain-containing protein [Vibrio europaeus]|uniref:phage tail sheath subtilisin-like domain-containing protein n=1 Tax=Vibrio europaeus TaxID=300876 RepID=UPI00233F1FA2|nr:phage tail sheath subtilisin-like domain-containing protein [Vibrio europaeus]MDC5753860.1 phage tail sheath subtilisin-like domain-containing protein [Vibrio europaeus]MDC5776772.1 phage tail sheath subtilisin-like domain-containing protein [Vibrio europaeus]MDC5796788.1 phage tail sheath subtilisin-like domain-containing protein [Vibrio europaeus]MDC5801785.1 phage tail sheath subtilisin-like domain-containing protein [Vibrio europaeus]MDC5815758.1 phage tail sheath subtilisin-like domain